MNLLLIKIYAICVKEAFFKMQWLDLIKINKIVNK